MLKVFLGGTKDSTWRDYVIERLKIDYVNPVVDDWNEQARLNEIEQRAKCSHLLYVITPLMTGVYAIAEAVQDSCKRPDQTIFCVINDDNDKTFDESQLRSLKAVADLIEANGSKVFTSLDDVIDYLNEQAVEIPPDPTIVECLIERDGPTYVRLQGYLYKFEKNELGDAVCRVANEDHRRYLCSLPEYRIYQEDKLPKPEFTPEEWEFIREWRTRPGPEFLAYYNGHTDRFLTASDKVKRLAIEKWQTLLPDHPCPIVIEGQEQATTHAENGGQGNGNDDYDPQSVKDLSDEDRAFYNKFARLDADQFYEFMQDTENEQKLLDAPDFIYDKAEEKWNRLVKPKYQKDWPFEEEFDDEDEQASDSIEEAAA